MRIEPNKCDGICFCTCHEVDDLGTGNTYIKEVKDVSRETSTKDISEDIEKNIIETILAYKK